MLPPSTLLSGAQRSEETDKDMHVVCMLLTRRPQVTEQCYFQVLLRNRYAVEGSGCHLCWSSGDLGKVNGNLPTGAPFRAPFRASQEAREESTAASQGLGDGGPASG